MPRTATNLEPYEAYIRQWTDDQINHEQMVARLAALQQDPITIGVRTLRRYLAAKGVRVRRAAHLNDGSDIPVRIADIFVNRRLSDKETVLVLGEDGYDIGLYTVGKIRRSLGLLKRTKAEDFADEADLIERQMVFEMAQGTIQDFGRGNLYGYFRTKYNTISRQVCATLGGLFIQTLAARPAWHTHCRMVPSQISFN